MDPAQIPKSVSRPTSTLALVRGYYYWLQKPRASEDPPFAEANAKNKKKAEAGVFSAPLSLIASHLSQVLKGQLSFSLKKDGKVRFIWVFNGMRRFLREIVEV